MTNDYNVAVINNLSKQYITTKPNSKDVIYTAKDVALSKKNNWIAPFGIVKLRKISFFRS